MIFESSQSDFEHFKNINEKNQFCSQRGSKDQKQNSLAKVHQKSLANQHSKSLEERQFGPTIGGETSDFVSNAKSVKMNNFELKKRVNY